MEKIYKTRFGVLDWVFTIVWSVLAANIFTLAANLFIPALRGNDWVYPILITFFFIAYIIDSVILTSHSLVIKNDKLSLFRGKKLLWAVPVSQITEIDKKQGNVWRKYDWFMSNFSSQIAFLVVADGKEYVARHQIKNYEQLLVDLKQLNPNIQFTDLTNRSDREYMQASRAAEARNEYNPDDPFSKVFGKWLPPQVIVWGAVIVIIILVVLGIYYTIMASK
jgi:hypothetical protein